MTERQQYIRVPPEECQQVRHGKTPCFNAFSQRNVVCNLCPVQLARETDIAAIHRMFHDGTCLMDEKNIASLGAQARARTSGHQEEATPIGLEASDIVEDRTKTIPLAKTSSINAAISPIIV